MDGDKDKAKEYLERAERVRFLAQSMADADSRKLLLSIAEDYERLAGTREQIARSDIARKDRDSKTPADD